jgi:hypothetical protein
MGNKGVKAPLLLLQVGCIPKKNDRNILVQMRITCEIPPPHSVDSNPAKSRVLTELIERDYVAGPSGPIELRDQQTGTERQEGQAPNYDRP